MPQRWPAWCNRARFRPTPRRTRATFHGARANCAWHARKAGRSARSLPDSKRMPGCCVLRHAISFAAMPSDVTIQAEPLRAVVRAIVAAGGPGAREAELVATQLVEANLTGHDSHGVGMLPRYVENLQSGGLAINRHVSIVRDSGPLSTLDGNAGYGQVMGF